MKQRARLQVLLLGRLEVRTGPGDALRLPSRKAAALLAYLALRPGHRHARSTLASLLWGDMGEEQARANLRHELFTLRRALGAHHTAMAMDAREVSLVASAVDTDLASFDRAVAAGGDQLRLAVDLYRDEFLAGFALREAAFEDWLRAERERLRGLALDALERWLTVCASDGRADEALGVGARALAIDPLRESTHRALMRLHARRGARAEVARRYQTCVDLLERELGTGPDPETTRLYRELMAGTPPTSEDRPAARTAIDGARITPAPAGPPLVGRTAEMATLGRFVDEAARGNGRVVMIAGEAGVGKTRLVEEVCARAREAGARVVVGHCYQSTSEFVLGAWIEALRQHVVGDEVLLAAIGAPYRAELATLLPEVAEGGATPVTAGPLRLFEAVGRVVDHWAAAAPLLLVLEDVHWADDMTLRLLTSVSRRVATARVLLVITAREEEPEERRRLEPAITELVRAGALHSLGVGALTRESADALVRLLGTGPEGESEPDVFDAVWRASEGNALAVVETMRAYGEGTLDVHAPGGVVAEPVRQLIRQRLDGLDASTRRVLEVAAVIGRSFDVRVLESATGLAAIAALEQVEELVRRRMLDDRSDGLDFSHDRIREVTLAGILPSRRRAFHGLVASALESLYGERLDDHVHALAVHCREAGAWDRAARYFWRAGNVAISRGANRRAIACYEDALAALVEMPDTTERLTLAIDVRIGVGHAILPLGDEDRLAQCVAEAQAMCERLEDHRRLVTVLALQTRHTVFWKDPSETLAAAERGYAVAARSTDPEQVGDAAYSLAVGASFVGDERRAVSIGRDLIERGLDVTRPGAVFTAPREVQLRVVMATSLAELGELHEARAIADAAIEIAEQQQRPYAIAMGSLVRGLALLRTEDVREAAASFERAAALSRANGYAIFSLMAPAGLAFARARLGSAEEVIAELETLVKATFDGGTRLWITYPSIWLAETYLLAQRLGDARRQAQATLALTKARGERTLEGWTLRLLGEIATRGEPSDLASAAACFEAALAIATAGGLRVLQAHCQLGLARAHGRAGSRARSREALAGARALLRELHLPAALAESDQALIG